MLRRAIVVGASSGMGAALAKRLAESGYRVAVIARSADRLQSLCEALNEPEQRVWSFVHDVTETGTTDEVFQSAVEALDGLDVVVYCAGIMPRIDESTYDTAIDRQVIEVNVIGAMAWLNLAAVRFTQQGHGTIVGIGSVAGDRGRKGNPAYSASKAALHTYLEALRNRLAPVGVNVVTVKPGPVSTPMTEGLGKQPFIIPAEAAAEAIFRAIEARSSTVYVPIIWAPIMMVIQHIPSMIFKKWGPA